MLYDKVIQLIFFVSSALPCFPNTQSDSVRLAAVTALHNLYSAEENLEALEMFTERFLPRIVQLASDRSDEIVIEACRVLETLCGYVFACVYVAIARCDEHILCLYFFNSSLIRWDVLEEDYFRDVDLLVFSEEVDIRRAAAKFVVVLKLLSRFIF